MADTQFIFGYGSLVETQSRTRTVPTAKDAYPVDVKGIHRGWFDQTPGNSLSTTFLGAVSESNFRCNGVIFKVTQQELEAFDKREDGYIRKRIDQKDITMLDGTKAPPDGDIWFYASAEKRYASPKFPIVQSYVDICLNGCLELEAKFPEAKKEEFAKNFLESTTNWSKYWVNDRIYPRRAFIYSPNANSIDGLIKAVLGEEAFSNIEIEPASWERR